MDWWRYYLETSAAFSRSMHQGTLVGRLVVWKLRHSVNVFWCLCVIWCCRFSCSTRHGTFVEILEVWKLWRLAHIFWCLGLIWCSCCHYVLRFYLRSVALCYSTCSDNAPRTPHPTHLSQLPYHIPFCFDLPWSVAFNNRVVSVGIELAVVFAMIGTTINNISLCCHVLVVEHCSRSWWIFHIWGKNQVDDVLWKRLRNN